MSKGSRVSSECGKTVVQVTYFVALLFLKREVTWKYSSFCGVVHDKKMFVQYQLARIRKPSVQHRKSHAAPKCVNNLE